MCDRSSPEEAGDPDSDPLEPLPAGQLLVPVRPGPAGRARVLRLFRTPLGAPTAVGFTSARGLAATLGPDQEYLRLGVRALRELTAPLGVALLTVDPQLAARPAAPAGAAPRTARLAAFS